MVYVRNDNTVGAMTLKNVPLITAMGEYKYCPLRYQSTKRHGSLSVCRPTNSQRSAQRCLQIALKLLPMNVPSITVISLYWAISMLICSSRIYFQIG